MFLVTCPKERLKRLEKNDILQNLNFIDNYAQIAWKESKLGKIRKNTTRSNQPVKIIRTDVYRIFDTLSYCLEKYLAIFIDDISHYRYVYLSKEKSQAICNLKIYINEIERNFDKKMMLYDLIMVVNIVENMVK